MHGFFRRRRRVIGSAAAVLVAMLATSAVAAHEERLVAGYTFEVGFADEPVVVGQRSGLDLSVHKGDAAVDHLESTLKAEVIYHDQHRDLPLEASEDGAGRYQSAFTPTAAGAYTFHIYGTVEGNTIDEAFTSSPTGFDEVQAVSSDEFPIQIPTQADLAADAEAGRSAASQVTVALALGTAGLVTGLIGISLGVASPRRRARGA